MKEQVQKKQEEPIPQVKGRSSSQSQKQDASQTTPPIIKLFPDESAEQASRSDRWGPETVEGIQMEDPQERIRRLDKLQKSGLLAPESDMPDPGNSKQSSEWDKRIQLVAEPDAALYIIQASIIPLHVDLDCIVIPVSRNASFGSFGNNLLNSISVEYNIIAKELNKSLSSKVKRPVESAFPVPLEIINPPARFPKNFILASATNKFGVADLSAARKAAVEVIRLSKRLGINTIGLPILGSGTAGLDIREATKAIIGGILSVPASDRPREITLLTDKENALETALEITRARVPRLENDRPIGNDTLDMAGEVYAIADSMLLKEMQPPMVLGILGGWGSGKSFALYLLKKRMMEIRALPVRQEKSQEEGDDFPFVGHVYFVTFNAWTYAKSNLWASLMHQIFSQVNSQLAFEQQLANAEVNVFSEGKFWRDLFDEDPSKVKSILESRASKDIISEARRADDGQDLSNFLWKRLQEFHRDEVKKLKRTERLLIKKRASLEKARNEIEKDVTKKIQLYAGGEAFRRNVPFLKGITGPGLTDEIDQVVEDIQAIDINAVDGVKKFESFLKRTAFLYKAARANPAEYGSLLMLAAGFWILPYTMPALSGLQAPGIVGGLISTVAAAQRSFSNWGKWSSEKMEQFERQVTEERNRLENLREKLRDEVLAAHNMEYQAKQKTTKKEVKKGTVGEAKPTEGQKPRAYIPEIEAQIHRLETTAKSIREELGPVEFETLADFVQARLQTQIYEKELGLMHQIQSDIEKLSRCFLEYDKFALANEKPKLFPRGPPRIILFIDDLDRCPPDRVVEVFEAVQLLIATDPFMVVLAMDVRYVTRALEAKYHGILVRKGDPSGLDYIEKIVQIPYRIRPIDPEAITAFIQAHMLPDDVQILGVSGGEKTSDQRGGQAGPSEPPKERAAANVQLPTSVLTFSAEEGKLLETHCKFLNLSPRSLKRLINVFRLLKIIWFRYSRQPTLEVEQAVIFILALAAKYPDAMREPLEDLGCSIQKGSDLTLGEFIENYTHVDLDNITKKVWDEIKELSSNPDFKFTGLRLRDFPLNTYNIMHSFSFVEDIGIEPKENVKEANKV